MPDQIFKGELERTISGLNKLRQENQFCDITLLVGSQKFAAHRIVLAASSEYFCKMFTGSLVEAHQQEVSLQAVDELVMESLLNFFYSSEIVLNEDNVEGVLSAACLFQLEDLKMACCKLLRRQLHPSNCLGVRDFAESYGCKELEKSAARYILDTFVWVALEEEFLLLPVAQLVKIISSNDLRIDAEEVVYKAVLRWVMYDVSQRQKHVSQLLSHIRLPLLGLDFLMDTVDCDPLICDTESCHLVKQAISQLLELQSGLEADSELLVVVGGTNKCVIMERFGSWPAQWKKCATISRSYIDCHAACLDGLVYLVGRLNGIQGSDCRAMDIFDLKSNQWSEGIPPSTLSGGLATLQGYLYNVGGRLHVSGGLSAPTTHVERYDPKLKIWTPVASLNTARTSCSVLAVGNFLYVLGGVDSDRSMERYDPLEDKWTFEAALPHAPEYRLSAAAFNGMIYVIGQKFIRDSTVHNSWKYDPTAMTWTRIKPPKYLMHKKKYRTSIVSINNQLYAVTDIFIDSDLNSSVYIEIYNEETNSWCKCGRMQFPFVHQQTRAATVMPSRKYSLEHFKTLPSVFKPMFTSAMSRKDALRVLPNFHKSRSCFEDALEDFENSGNEEDCDFEHSFFNPNAYTYDDEEYGDFGVENDDVDDDYDDDEYMANFE